MRGLICLLALPLAACAQAVPSAQQQLLSRDYSAQFASTDADCRRKHPNGWQKKPITPYVACYFGGRAEYTAGDPLVSDTEARLRIKMVQLAESYDKGEMSFERFQAETASYQQLANSEVAATRQGLASSMQAQAYADQQRRAAMIATGAMIMSGGPRATCVQNGAVAQCY